MEIKNTFRAIGICYNDTKYYRKQDNSLVASTILAYSDSNGKRKYIPIIAYGDNADLLIRLARNGNLVAISGYIDTTEYFDKNSGSSSIRVFFVMEDIMVIEKMNPTRLSEKRIEDLLTTFNLE